MLEVAALLNAQLAGNRVYSDAWGFDAAWVARLFDAAGLSQHFRIDTVRNLIAETAYRPGPQPGPGPRPAWGGCPSRGA